MAPVYCRDNLQEWCGDGESKRSTKTPNVQSDETCDNALTYLTSFFHFIKSSVEFKDDDRLILIVATAFCILFLDSV